ncbi:hypothetical protein MPSI1_000074 [Malassezia psittaci]|uniref:ABC1 atypical kinase-like domain-containing protein n=1 Tax=Malassezia psittaci TaxID=1821823 RepID=A0AAF0F6G1_9BASI|nr:hypothetical protein MPSI1_000074 [Malassezia psittaci]
MYALRARLRASRLVDKCLQRTVHDAPKHRTAPPPPKFPPGTRAPETTLFSEPAVPHPHRAANSHATFRKGSRVVLIGGGLLFLGGSAVYYGYGKPSADAGNTRQDAGLLSLSGMENVYGELKRSLNDTHASQTAQFLFLALARSTVIVKAAGLCVWDYRRTLNAKYSSKEQEDDALRDCHLKCAQRVLAALQANGGLYIKLGQHLSSIILLPPEWTNTMKPLQDQNEPTPLAELEVLFKDETGKSFDEAFAWIDPKPLGVASLAQVHRACDKETGQVLAIKMLHPNVERFSNVDMRMVTTLVHWVKRVFPDFSFEWLADEMNKNLPLELDFRHEAANSRRAQKDFERYKHTCVTFPQVPWVHRRVLAMEYIQGSRPDDLVYLAEHHIDRNRVSQKLSEIFSQMLYIHGFFHADPHGGNLLIRPRQKHSRSKENFEIVLLDHGLYFEIDEELRSNYARFWLSLLSRATPKVQRERRKYAKLVGNIGDDLYPILESAITGRSGLEGSDELNPNGVKGKKRMSSLLELDGGTKMPEAEQEHIRKTVMEKEGMFLNVLEVLRSVPRAMLMVLKINDLTRSLDANLHTTHGPARPFIITARYCALAVRDNDKKKFAQRRTSQGWSFGLLRDDWSSYWNYLYFYQGLMLTERASDVLAGVRKYFVYAKTLFTHRFDTEAAHRAASGLEDLARREERQNADREKAMLALQSDAAEEVVAEES